MHSENPNFDDLASWLNTEGLEHPDLADTIPERRACLNALRDLKEFFDAHPEVEMMGFDRIETSDVELDRLEGQYASQKGSWVETGSGSAHQDFQALVDHLNHHFMEGPEAFSQFCLERLFSADPGGDFGFFTSRQGIDQAVKNSLSATPYRGKDSSAPQI